jgi:hypothetical protein
MSVRFKGETVNRQQILQVLDQFKHDYPDTNDYDNWLDKGTYRYALQYQNRLYPCKYILSQATGVPTANFNGGKETNRVFNN